ncbi:MAG: glycoside hydrolase family 2 TIM barrel-domain containing protein [Acidobacteriota bacterium]
MLSPPLLGRLLLAVLPSLALGDLPVRAQGPGPSIVQVSGRQLVVRKRNPDGTLGAAAPYTMRGVVWSPASKTTNTSPHDPNGAVVRRPELALWAATDIPLMAGMNANTVRMFLDPGVGSQGAAGRAVLDRLYARGLMVVLTVDDTVDDTARISSAVNLYKDHPAVLLWMIGNEWNINRFYGEASSVLNAAQRAEAAATLIKSLDSHHPVATSYGEIDINSDGLRLADTSHYVNDVAPSVDVWSLNVYRSSSFGSLFAEWASISTKPMFLGEFGTDAYASTCARTNPPTGAIDERTQRRWDLSLWNEIASHLSANDPAQVALGGTVFALSDEWWKVSPAGAQQTGGFLFVNGHPDDFANEEYWGLTDIDRIPREAYYGMRLAFAAGSSEVPPFRVDFFTMPAAVTTNLPAFLIAGTVQKGSRAFLNGSEIPVDGGGTFAVRFPVSIAQILAVGPNAVTLRIVGPDASETTTIKTIDFEPTFSTGGERLLYVDSVAPGVSGTVVLDLDTGTILGLLDQQHVRGVAADGSAVYMDTRGVIDTATHAAAGASLPFTSPIPVDGFLVSPLGDFLYSRNEIVDRAANTLSASHLPANLVSGNTFGGATVPGGPAITPDGQFLFAGTSGNLIRIDRPSLTSMSINPSFGGAFLSDYTVSPDGGTLARTTYGGAVPQVQFYDSGSLALTGTGLGPGDFASEVVFSSASQCAIVGSAGNPANRGGNLTAIEIPGFGQGACSLIDLADNLVISGGDQIYVTSGTRFGIDVYDLEPCGALKRRRTYFLGINQFVLSTGSPKNDDIKRIVLRDLPTLNVETAGTGGGTVASSPTGINCGADCSEGYSFGTQVTLTATPTTGSHFAGWAGDGSCAGTGACTVVLDTDRSATATFNVNVIPPAAPTELRVDRIPGRPTQLKLVWHDNSSNESGFKVERKRKCCGTWTVLPNAPANSTSTATYRSIGLRCGGTRYAYRVSAFNAGGVSARSNEAERATLPCN